MAKWKRYFWSSRNKYHIPWCMHTELLQSSSALSDPMDCNPPDSSVHGILQPRILEWVAMPYPGDLPDPGIEPMSLMSLHWQADSLPLVPPGKFWFTMWPWVNCHLSVSVGFWVITEEPTQSSSNWKGNVFTNSTNILRSVNHMWLYG